MRDIQHYVCGFLFNVNEPSGHEDVLLIRKEKPEWQRGRLNGVGGKVEPGENPLQAMTREFQEEASRPISAWYYFYELRTGRSVVHFFSALTTSTAGIQAMTRETLEWHPWNNLPPDVLPNLRWLVPMAIDTDTWKTPTPQLISRTVPWSDQYRPH